MKQCSKCGAAVEDDAQRCSSCGASQAVGVSKVAETAGLLDRGALRAVLGGAAGAGGGWFFYMILFSFSTEVAGGLSGWTAIGIFALICAVIGAVFSAPSLKFMWLMAYWYIYTTIGFPIFTFTTPYFHNYIPGKIIYIFFLIILVPLTWIWHITKAGLVTAKPKKMGIVKSTKMELVDTVKEIKRFGRR